MQEAGAPERGPERLRVRCEVRTVWARQPRGAVHDAHPRLRIEIGKRRDGATTFRLVRADGSATWQRHEKPKAAFFPLHDLEHFAVETVLGHSRGFYGLVAEGWELGDFGTPWPRGPMPADMDPSESIVGFLDLERATGVELTADEVNDQLQAKLGERHASVRIAEEELARVRAVVRELHTRWWELPQGETMTLEFDVS